MWTILFICGELGGGKHKLLWGRCPQKCFIVLLQGCQPSCFMASLDVFSLLKMTVLFSWCYSNFQCFLIVFFKKIKNRARNIIILPQIYLKMRKNAKLWGKIPKKFCACCALHFGIFIHFKISKFCVF